MCGIAEIAIRSFLSSSQIHRLTSFGDVEITGSRGRGLVGVCPAGVFVGLFCLGKADSCRRDVRDLGLCRGAFWSSETW